MSGLERIATVEQIDQFVGLWHMLQQVQLTDNRDSIRWSISTSGSYSARSAYDAQFLGRIPKPALNRVWTTKVEQKVKFYTWLLLQNRNWTADRLSARGWPHSTLCSFCDQVLESASHLLLGCPFAKEVWQLIASVQPRVAAIALSCQSVKEWWRRLCTEGRRAARKEEIGVGVYVAWHLWKERNWRIFQGLSLSANGILQLIRDDLAQVRVVFWE